MALKMKKREDRGKEISQKVEQKTKAKKKNGREKIRNLEVLLRNNIVTGRENGEMEEEKFTQTHYSKEFCLSEFKKLRLIKSLIYARYSSKCLTQSNLLNPHNNLM